MTQTLVPTIQKTDGEKLQAQFISIVMDDRTVELSQLQHIEKIVDDTVAIHQVPIIQTEQKMLEVPQSQFFFDREVVVHVVMQRQTSMIQASTIQMAQPRSPRCLLLTVECRHECDECQWGDRQRATDSDLGDKKSSLPMTLPTEVNELMRTLAADSRASAEVRVTPIVTVTVIRASRASEVLDRRRDSGGD